GLTIEAAARAARRAPSARLRVPVRTVQHPDSRCGPAGRVQLGGDDRPRLDDAQRGRSVHVGSRAGRRRRVAPGLRDQARPEHALRHHLERRGGAQHVPAPAGLIEVLREARVLGVRVDCLDMSSALGEIERFVDQGGPHLVATLNPEFVMRAQGDREFARVLDSAALCLADGTGVVWAARRMGCTLAGPVAGADLVEPLAALCGRRGFRLFLLGAKPGVADELAAQLRSANPGLLVAAYAGGPSPSFDVETLELVHAHKTDVLLVA